MLKFNLNSFRTRAAKLAPVILIGIIIYNTLEGVSSNVLQQIAQAFDMKMKLPWHGNKLNLSYQNIIPQ